MPRSKEKKTYSFFQNAAFLWRLHWAFDRMLLLLMALKTPLTVGAALLGILLPKLVLDHVTRHSDLHVMLLQIAGCALGLLLFKAADAKNDNAMEIHANQFFCLYGFTQIAKKKMDLDYEAYSAPSGKTKAEKASMAVSGNTYSSMVAFYPGLRDVLSNLFGFASFAAIVFTLNPLVILLLLASYAMDGLIALYVEKRQNKLREQEADLRRRTRYIAKRTSLTAFAKEIRI